YFYFRPSLHKQLLNMRHSLHLTFMCLSLLTGRMCIQGNQFNIKASRSDKLSLPGFENLTAGYNKFLRPNFGGTLGGFNLLWFSQDQLNTNDKHFSDPDVLERQDLYRVFQGLSWTAQDYTATIYLRQRWTDKRLVFEGNKSFTLDARLVEFLWVPDTYIVESKKSFLHEVTVGNRLIRLFSNGTVLYALR
ncbi:Gamma-aminobutyric acid receptor subunit pi, partial [Eschrichtius robustus]|nr:Gamma-aminobutyric acid receptor subunit pi [Eschrichtius robustus]